MKRWLYALLLTGMGMCISMNTSPYLIYPPMTMPSTTGCQFPTERADTPDRYWVDVDLNNQTLYLCKHDYTVSAWLISSGAPGRATRPGLYRVYAKYVSYPSWGIDWHYDLPYTLFFHHDLAIHGAYWHEDFGTPVSHGCINAPVIVARVLYRYMDRGSYVYVR